MGDASRLRIILSCMGDPISAGDIAHRLGLSASLVSHHLRLLKAARILRGDRRGKQVYYCVLDHHISCVIRDMVEHVTEPVANRP
jgi:DNA-binding transcriptional ArsR family regulator